MDLVYSALFAIYTVYKCLQKTVKTHTCKCSKSSKLMMINAETNVYAERYAELSLLKLN